MKTIKTLALVSILVVGMTASTFASWWNPFTWSIFTKKQVVKSEEKLLTKENSGTAINESPNTKNTNVEVSSTTKNNEVYIGNKFEVTIPSSWKKISTGNDNLKIVSLEYSENSPFSKNENERNMAEFMPIKSGSMIVISTKDAKELSTRLLDSVEYARFHIELGKDYSGFLMSKEISIDGVPAALSKVSLANGSLVTYVKLIKKGEQFEITFYTTKNESDSIVLDSILSSFKFIK